MSDLVRCILSFNFGLRSSIYKKCILGNSASKHLHYCKYSNRLKDCVKGTLVSWVLTYCNKNDINFTKYVFNNSYALNMNKLLNQNINIDEGGLVAGACPGFLKGGVQYLLVP